MILKCVKKIDVILTIKCFKQKLMITVTDIIKLLEFIIRVILVFQSYCLEKKCERFLLLREHPHITTTSERKEKVSQFFQ